MTATITPELTLPNGHKMPRVGLGSTTWHHPSPEELDQIEQGVKSALRMGYRHLDTATLYGTEEVIGRAIRECIAEGTVHRDDLYVTTKLWSTCHRKELVEPALRQSLHRLGLDYVDQYLIHWPVPLQPSEKVYPTDANGKLLFDEDSSDHTITWQAMEQCQKLGLARTIGLSNFNRRQVQRILDHCSIKPAINQVESHPYHKNEKLIDFCRSKDMAICCWAPLFSSDRLQVCNMYADPILVDIAARLNRTVAQVALRFQLQRGLAVIPYSINPSHQADNLHVFDFALSEADMAKIFGISKRHVIGFSIIGPSYLGSKEYPFDED